MSAVALAALLVGSCGGRPARPVVPVSTPAPPASASPAVDRRCDAGERQVVGPYVYVNNQWGRGKVPAGQPFEQCLLSRTVGGTPQYGWSFRWPGHDPSVFAYPEIIFGWTPWGGGESSDPRFPMPVRDMPPLELTYAVESVIEGHFNLAPEVWLMRTGGDGPRRPSDIATEIMFWLDYDETMRPSGSVVATVTVDGVAYDLYKAEGGNEKASWTYLAYKGPRGRSAGSLRLDAFIRDAVARGYASEAHHLAGVEFGNECAGGDGRTWVTRYEVRVGR
jgi:hypothetical protein